MRLYADRTDHRTRQVLVDLLLLGWVALWLTLAQTVHETVLVLGRPGVELAELGASISSTMGDAAGVAGDVPLVGDDLAVPFQALGDSGSGMAGAGQGLQDAVGTLALVLALALVVIPVGWALARWVPWRLRWSREATAATRLSTAAPDLELLAARAVATAPLPALAALPAGTGAAWRTGDPAAVRALAGLELRRLGLQIPSEGAVDRPQLR